MGVCKISHFAFKTLLIGWLVVFFVGLTINFLQIGKL